MILIISKKFIVFIVVVLMLALAISGGILYAKTKYVAAGKRIGGVYKTHQSLMV